ncbi:MAG: hypothetical protein LC641_12945, partial [Spirochaeta sp.]|nr:hypothetical protein [Spirochaeta sp.]
MRGWQRQYAISLLFLVFALGSCENPFSSSSSPLSPGLGEKVDIERPVIRVLSPEPGSFLRGSASFEGSVSDDESVRSVEISLDGGGSWNPVSNFKADSKVWSHTLETAATNDGGDARFPEGPLVLRFRATDSAGKPTATDELVYTVNNAGPAIEIIVPQIDLADYDEGDPPVVPMNGIIIGTVSAAQGVAAQSPEIKFWLDGDLEPAEWTPLRPGATSTPQALQYEYRLRDFLENQIGEFRLRIRASETGGMETVVPEEASEGFLVSVVSLDAPPVLSGFAFSDGDVIVGTGNNYAPSEFSFTVTASDATGLQSVLLTRISDGGTSESLAWASSSGDSNLSSYTSPVFTVLDAGSMDDGTYEFVMEAISVTGGTALLRRTVVVDTTPPEVLISNLQPVIQLPGDPVERVNGIIGLSVATGDANGIDTVKWWLLPVSDPEPEFNSSDANIFASTPYSVEIDSRLAEYPDGDYTLYVGARDRAGNEELISRALIIDQDSDIPTVTFTDLSPDVSQSDAEDAGVDFVNLLDTNARVRGQIEDDDGVDVSSIEINLNGSGWAQVDSTGAPGRTVSFTHNVDALGEGTHFFSLRFADDVDEKPDGVDSVQREVGPVYFIIDTAPPLLNIASPAPGSFYGTGFLLSGTATDSNGLQIHDFGGATGERTYVEIATPESPTTWEKVPVDSDTDDWSLLVADDAELFNGVYDGANDISVRTRDRFGKLTTNTLLFNVDTTAPSVTIEQPSDPGDGNVLWLDGASSTVSVSSVDVESGVATVRIWVGDTGVDPPANLNEWPQAILAANWNVTLNLGELGEGSKTAHVFAVDNAGNESDVVTREFGVDQAAPGVTEDELGTAAADRNSEFDIGGEISDSNELASLAVTQTLAAADPVTVTVYELGDIGGESASWQVPSLPRDPAAADPTEEVAAVADGVYTYTVTVTDVAGRVSTLTREVRIDQEGPVMAITSPASGAVLQGTALLVTGTAVKAAGLSPVSEVRYWFGAAGDTAESFGSWPQASGTANWTATLDLPAGQEGERVLRVVGRDAAGNWSAPSAAATESVAFSIDQAPPQ